MENIESVLKEITEENQYRVDWTKAWSGKYPVLKTYQSQVDISRYAAEIQALLNGLQDEYGYSDQDAMLVLKDILYHEYMNKRK